MSRQLDLFGKPVARRGAIYHSPKNRYENFVNAFAACHPSLTPVDVKRKADNAWRELGKGENDAKVEKMLSAAASLEEKDKRLVRTSFVVGHYRDKQSETQPSASISNPPIVTPVEPSPSKNIDARATKESRSLSLMKDFLTRHVGMNSAAVKCLLSPDVVANVIVVETISDVAATV